MGGNFCGGIEVRAGIMGVCIWCNGNGEEQFVYEDVETDFFSECYKGSF